MPMYEYKCRRCGQVYDADHRIENGPGGEYNLIARCQCSGDLKRVFGFSYIRPMQAGYNPSVGKHISNMGQLKSEFARMSDEAEMYTGNPHKFVPIDPMDKETLGVTDEGLGATHDQQVAQGIKEPAQRLIFP